MTATTLPRAAASGALDEDIAYARVTWRLVIATSLVVGGAIVLKIAQHGARRSAT